MDIRLALMAGSDIPIPECQITLKQPTIKEISYIGEEDFFIGVQSLTLNKNMFSQDEKLLSQITNFQIFMTIMHEKETADKKQRVMSVLYLLFPKYKILFTPQSIIFQEEGQAHMIDENNFDAFQNVVRMAFCSKDGPMDQQSFNPASKKAKEIADKLMRGRQRVAELKGSQNVSVFAQYTSVLSIALHISLNELLNYTMYQLYDIMERYSLYVNWDLDVRTRLAGGKPDSQPENWMKSLH